MARRSISAWGAAVMLALATPGYAQSETSDPTSNSEFSVPMETIDSIDQLLRPEDRDLRAALIRVFEEADPTNAITKIDALLPRVDDGSAINAFLLSVRATMTIKAGLIDEGRADFEALIDRYPNFPGVKFAAIDSLAYNSAADLAAREWVNLAARYPAAARAISGYTLGALAHNLRARGDIDELLALFLALDRIEYDPGSVALHDEMQMAIFANAAADTGREEQALSALNKVSDPALHILVAAQSRYRDYWSHIDLDVDALDAQRAVHLHNLKGDFLKAENGLAGGSYLRAAAEIGDPKFVATEYDELLRSLSPGSSDSIYRNYDTAFWVSPIAKAWLAAGSPERAEKLFGDALAWYANLTGTINLNITSNYASMLLDFDRPREALALIEPSIIELTSAEQAIAALTQMHVVRLRGYHQIGQIEAAADSLRHLEAARNTQLSTYVFAMLAIGNGDAAEAALIANLQSADPEQAIHLLQCPLHPPYLPSEIAFQKKLDRLRSAPDITVALEKVGRIVDIPALSFVDMDHMIIAGMFPENP